MTRTASFSIMSTVLVMVTSIGLLLTASGTPTLAIAPTKPPIATPQQPNKPNPTPQPPETSFDSNKIGKPVLPDQLFAKYPTLKAYIAKLDEIDEDEIADKLDFAELYKWMALIAKDYGNIGVIVFLQETDLVEELGIPDQYYDLIILFEQGGFDKILAQAKSLKLLNDKGELLAFVVIYPDDELEAVKTALQKKGVSIYAYDKEEGTLDIGIPGQLMRDLKTPDTVMKFWASIYQIESVDEFDTPDTGLQSLKSK